MEVNVAEYLLSKRINLNQEILISLVYPDANPDTLFYSGVFLYQMDVVAVVVYDYLDFKF